MQVNDAGWTGEGRFTPVLIEALTGLGTIAALRVEDAPSSRADAGYALIANEVFVTFRTEAVVEPIRRFGFLPGTRTVQKRVMTLSGLVEALTAADTVGAPDYADDGMVQYLRTERIVPPYQTRGVKVVELVRIYEAL